MGLNAVSTALALVSSSVLLVAALFLDDAKTDNCATIGYSNSSLMTYCVGWNNAYAFSVAIVGITVCSVILILAKWRPVILVKTVGSMTLPKVGAVTVDLLLSCFVFVWLTVGAFVLTTMEEHGFSKLSNGYFACWAGAIASLGNLGVDRAALVQAGPVFGLKIASIVILIQSTQTMDVLYIQFAFVVSIISLVFTTSYMLYGDHLEAVFEGKLSTVIKVTMLLLWIIEAFWTTFPAESPFHEAGNGYFGSWIAVMMIAQISTLKTVITANMTALNTELSTKTASATKSSTSVEWTPTTNQALGDGDIVEAPSKAPIGGTITPDISVTSSEA